MEFKEKLVLSAAVIVTFLGWALFFVTQQGHFFVVTFTAVVCAGWYRGLVAGILTGILVPIVAGILMVVVDFEISVVARNITGFLIMSVLVGASVGGLSDMNQKLVRANRKVKRLEGMITICANCRSVRSDGGLWGELEAYVRDHSDAEFTHGVCPNCAKELFPGCDDIIENAVEG